MAQHKKEPVRTAILQAAFHLFAAQGYAATSLPAIAREAGISTANVYVYFASKLDILFELYETWLKAQLEALDRRLRRIEPVEKRLARFVTAMWRDIPRQDNGFANTMMQALSMSVGSPHYTPRLRKLFLAHVTGWLMECVALRRADAQALARIILMAFDGYTLNARLAHGEACDARTAQLFASMVRALAARKA